VRVWFCRFYAVNVTATATASWHDSERLDFVLRTASQIESVSLDFEAGLDFSGLSWAVASASCQFFCFKIQTYGLALTCCLLFVVCVGFFVYFCEKKDCIRFELVVLC